MKRKPPRHMGWQARPPRRVNLFKNGISDQSRRISGSIAQAGYDPFSRRDIRFIAHQSSIKPSLLMRILEGEENKGFDISSRKHGLFSQIMADQKPWKGEYLDCRPIGLDWSPGCFVCGGPTDMYPNFAGFVRSSLAGQRIVDMFNGSGAWLDFRDFEPSWIQVKIAACVQHQPNLEKLRHAIEVDSIITHQMVNQAAKG